MARGILGRGVRGTAGWLWLPVVLAQVAHGFWPGECGGDPGRWALTDNHDLDCALRQLTLDRAVAVLGRDTSAQAIYDGLNGGLCNLTIPTTPRQQSTSASTAAQPAATTIVVGTGGAGVVDSIAEALRITRAAGSGPKSVVLKAGTYYEQVNLGPEDSGTTIAAAAGAEVTISGGLPFTNLSWVPVTASLSSTAPSWGVGAFKAALPAPLPQGMSSFTGLFRDGRRLTRARFPNCADVTSTSCYTLNASGPAGTSPNAPMTPLQNTPGSMNLEVMNQNGVDMFADGPDDAKATGPHGASDGTLGHTNLTIVVDHPDYAWRCHEDCGWVAYSKWRSLLCDNADPNACRFDQTYNQQYWDQQVSGAFYYNDTDATWTPRAWADPSTGVVHMYHSSRWGGWIFQLQARNDSDARLTFACRLLKPAGVADDGTGRVLYEADAELVECPTNGDPAVVIGGWQEGRGGDIGVRYTDHRFNNSYFVENIKEELDFPDEWFFAADEGPHGTLYLMPSSPADAAANFSHPTPGKAITVVATRHQRVVQALGEEGRPVKDVKIEGVTIAHAEATYLGRYEIPSGGDWAISRSAAVFFDGVETSAITDCRFDQVDGNGVFLSRHVRNCTVARNDFVALGETAILVSGASGEHRTNQANSTLYPAFNTIDQNYVGVVGVWNKQSAAYFKSVARENVISRNVFHDGPRSGVNFNDGAMGGEVLQDNVIFNYVRESNDHGPFNSWDRQPYIYRVDEANPAGTLAISPQTQLITRNVVINFNFHGPACGSIAIDFDDESSQYEVNNNVLLYGGVKCFDGMDRHVHDNLVVYPYASPIAKQACFHALSSTRNRSSAHTHFVSNHCVLRPGDYPYNCGAGPAPWYNKTMHVQVDANIFSFPGATAEPSWEGACACYPGPKTGAPPCPYKTFADWQAQGHDVHSSIQLSLSNAAVIAEAKAHLAA